MPNLIVADSGPIISFARAGRLQLIRNLYKQIIIPNAVYEEIVVKGANKPGATEVKSASWITVRKAANRDGVEKLLSGHFDFGESEAIILAGELGAVLLADEWIVIREARRRGLEISSSLLMLVQAKRIKLIKNVKPELNALIAAGFRTTPELVRIALQRAGE